MESRSAKLQIVDVVGPSLDLPDWSMRVALILGVCALPVIIALAWFLDLTPATALAATDSHKTLASGSEDRRCRVCAHAARSCYRWRVLLRARFHHGPLARAVT